MSILKRVRELRNLSEAAVAEYSGIALTRLEEFEKGRRRPSVLQLEKLADLYNISPFALMANQIPNLDVVPTDYRKIEPGPAEVSPRALQNIWRVEHVSAFAKRLSEELAFAPLEMPQALMDKRQPEARAQILRSAFELWYRQCEDALAFAGSPEARFLGALRVYLEARGVATSVNDAPPKDYLGFFVSAPASFPSIFINRKILSKKAQLFTFAHEIYHYIENKTGISNPFRARNEIERACNKFAAEFLAPQSEFSRLAERASKEVRSSTTNFVSFMSRNTLLSNHAAAIRLVETGYINQEQLSSWTKGWSRLLTEEKSDEQAEAPNFGVVHAKRLGEIGYLPVILAAKALQKGIIDDLDVVKGIGLAESIQTKSFDLAARRFDEAGIK